MFGTPTSALVRLVIRLGAAAVGILLLFAGLVRAEPDRHDVLTNTSEALKDELPLQRATHTYLCLTRLERRMGSEKTVDAGHRKTGSPVGCPRRTDRTPTPVWAAV
jgi:hypothetical protein